MLRVLRRYSKAVKYYKILICVVFGTTISYSAINNKDNSSLFSVVSASIALITLFFYIIQDLQNKRLRSARIIDNYYESLSKARFRCFNTIVALHENNLLFNKLLTQITEKKYVSFGVQKYVDIPIKNLINNTLVESIINIDQGLHILNLNNKNLYSQYSEMALLAHTIAMSGGSIVPQVIEHDRNTICNALRYYIEKHEKTIGKYEYLLNEIQLHINNLNYTYYTSNPDKMIKKSLLYIPEREDIESMLDETKKLLELAYKQYGIGLITE